MVNRTEVAVEALLGPGDVSQILKVSPATLRHWRAVGRGPEYLRVGRHVRYRPSAIEEWLEEDRGAAVEL